MAYSIEASPDFLRDYKKLCSKNSVFKQAVDLKIRQICEALEFNPEHYKPLAAPLAGVRRVHVGSFVLLFDVDKTRKTIKLLVLEHHDRAYKR
ncbi:MAG: type II toxin-antitoxin system RelE/ParE family toxin [Candidatus Micrarchaeota archaeon]